MSKSKLIAGLTSVAIFATSLAVAPAASAVQLHSEERSGRPICVATLSDRETQVSKDFFQYHIDEYLKLQDRLRSAYPQFSDLYEEVDGRIEQGENFDNYYLRQWLSPIQEAGFGYGEIELFAFQGTDIYRSYTELAKSGLQVNVEIVPGWTKNEMISYPYTTIPVIAVGGNWSSQETFSQSVDAYHIVNGVYPYGSLHSSSHSAPLRPIVQPHILSLLDLQEEFHASVSYDALDRAADDCLNSLEVGSLPPVGAVPTTTYAPTVTVTAAPSTVTETPEPTTVTAEPSTVVVEPSPVTTTAATETVTETPAPVTSTAPVETVVETPAPATSTAATKTVTVTPAPVTTTKAKETVTVTPEPTTSTAAPETVVETPVPVTSTAATGTTTVTPAPVTSTKARDTVVVTPAPATSTATKPTVTVTAEPTTVTTTPTVTVSADPAEVTEPEDAPEEKGSEGMGMLPIIIAILAALGGIAGFILNSPAILQGLI